jgi:hypothetical protein
MVDAVALASLVSDGRENKKPAEAGPLSHFEQIARFGTLPVRVGAGVLLLLLLQFLGAIALLALGHLGVAAVAAAACLLIASALFLCLLHCPSSINRKDKLRPAQAVPNLLGINRRRAPQKQKPDDVSVFGLLASGVGCGSRI